MQIIVLGAGAIGSLYGAKLAATNEVTLVAREEHAAAINAHGLQVKGHDAGIRRLHAETGVKAIAPDTLILLTTKVSGTTAALAPLASLVRDDTTVLCLQNGLGSEALVQKALNDRGVVLRAITQAGAIFEEAGVVNYTVIGETVLEQHERAQRIADVFVAAGLETRVSPSIEHEVWQKLIFNCVVNPITAILGSEVGAIANPRLDRLKQLVIDECLAVAAAEGVTFKLDFLGTINQLYAPSRNIVSMLQDLRRGRQTEIDYLNGAIVSLGEKHGIDCRLNRALTAIIRTMQARS